MKIERTKNASRNIAFGIILKIYQIILPFVMRTIMIYLMGIEYAGLNNLFSSIFQILNLAELGVGAALTYSMYKPIAEDDTNKICALLKLYKICFEIIGIIILGLGLICVPFLPYLINGSIPDNLNLYVLYLLYLTNTVLSYWLFSYKKSLIYAHQRTDINSKIMIITYTIQYIGQIIILFALKNYYLYLLMSIISQILNNILAVYIVNKIYFNYIPKGDLEKEILDEIVSKVQGLITNKIGSVILRSADTIVISMFLGLRILAIYQNYYFILVSVTSIFSMIFEACLAGIGNSLIVEKKEKNYSDFKTMTFIISWLIAICCCCFVTLYQPFIALWVGKNHLMDYPLVICMVVYFFVYEVDALLSTYKDAAGIWYSDRYRPLITAIINLIMNVILVQVIGLYGILLSTIVSLVFIGIPWLLHNIFNFLFKGESIIKYVLYLLKFAVLTYISSYITILMTNFVNGNIIIVLFIRGIFAIIIPNIIMFPFFYKSSEFKRIEKILKNLIGRKNNS